MRCANLTDEKFAQFIVGTPTLYIFCTPLQRGVQKMYEVEVR